MSGRSPAASLGGWRDVNRDLLLLLGATSMAVVGSLLSSSDSHLLNYSGPVRRLWVGLKIDLMVDLLWFRR